MRRAVLVLLTVLMLASACAGNDAANEPSATPVDDTTATEPTATGDDPAALLPVVVRPAYDPAGDAAVYLHGLAVWVLETEDGGWVGDPDELTAASRQASICYASAFVSVLDPNRLTEAAGVLAVQGLLSGFPLDVVTDAERDRLYILAAPCLNAAWQYEIASSAPQDFLDADIEFTEEQKASLTAGFEECLETLIADVNSRAWLLETALFDSPAAEQQLMAALLNVCSESFLTPMLTEQFVAEGYARDIAECVGPLTVELLADTPAQFTALPATGPDVYDPEEAAAITAVLLAIQSECDGVEDLFLQ